MQTQKNKKGLPRYAPPRQTHISRVFIENHISHVDTNCYRITKQTIIDETHLYIAPKGDISEAEYKRILKGGDTKLKFFFASVGGKKVKFILKTQK